MLPGGWPARRGGRYGCGAERYWTASDPDPGVSRGSPVLDGGATGGLVFYWGDESSWASIAHDGRDPASGGRGAGGLYHY